MDNSKSANNQQRSPSGRRMSGPVFDGLMNQKRGSDPLNMARRQSLQDQKPQAGFLGQMWHKARAADELSAWDGFSSAESETLAPEQSSFCRVARGSVAILDMTIPPLPAYCPYYRAYLLQKEPKNWWHWRPSNKAKEDKNVYQRP
ncbi:hypothetical protein MGN70_005253 [Eutypa lata]|nr:hypothetical protein MGN70_005253 [Eutypa lata]